MLRVTDVPSRGTGTSISTARHLRQKLRVMLQASAEKVVITRHGRPGGVLIGSESEDDWFEYRLGRSYREPSFFLEPGSRLGLRKFSHHFYEACEPARE